MIRNKVLAALTATVLMTSALTGPTRAAAPKLVGDLPAKAPVFVVVKNLSQLSAKLAALDNALGLNNPQLQNGLAFVKAMSGMNAGVNDDGSLGVVMMNVPLPGPNGEQPQPMAAVLVPVNDYNAFLGNFNAQKNGDIAQFDMTGQTTYAKSVDGYAVISNTQEAVQKYTAGGGNQYADFSGYFGEKLMSDSDVMVYVDMGTLGPIVQPFVALGLMQAQQQLQDPNVPNNAAAQAMVGIYGDAISALLRDSQSMAIGLDLTQNGVGLSMSAQFKPNTPLAAMFEKSGGNNVDFDRLPSGQYLVASSMDLGALPLEQWISAISSRMPDDNPLGGIFTNAIEMMKAAGDQSQQAYYVPEAPGGGGMSSFFHGVTVYSADDPGKLLAESRKSISALNNMELAPNAKYVTQYNENVMQVDGKQVDQYSLKMQLPPEMMKELGPAAMLVAGDMGGYMVATDNAVVMTTGADPLLIKQAIATADGKGADSLSKDSGIANIRSQLYDRRVSETYIGVGGIMSLINKFLVMFAPDAALTVPENLPPVAQSVSVHESGLGMRSFVPMETIIAVKNAVQKVMQQGTGGNQGVTAAPAPQPAQPEPVTQKPAEQPEPVAAAEPAPAKAPTPKVKPREPVEIDKPVAQKITVEDRAESEHVVTLTDDNFRQLATESDKPVIVDFWATWCGPCKTQAPILSDIADKHAGEVLIGKLDVDKNPRTTQMYGIRLIPTLVILKDGKVAERFEGLTSGDRLEAALAQLQ